jgi:adenosylcobyric acid synthase
MGKNIMFQGTGSSVGKSLLTAALCRILNNKGYRVAPFKSQNMALNSYITDDGKEMGRAQVVQAEAARIKPEVAMNPILLKPNSDVGSQVILMGKAEFNMEAQEYHAYKSELKALIEEVYEEISSRFDAIVIEGAGSPAEINLRENDLVNMGMAEIADSPVILIGDIDKGGVFASVYGTVELMLPEERERIKGFIINKFRGDVELLKPGIEIIEGKTNIPCLGVVPYAMLQIDDEDGASNRLTHKTDGEILIGVVRLPHISNFTDFTAFDMYDDVEVRYIHFVEDMVVEKPDLLIIPGSKNTIEDLNWLKSTGFSDVIMKYHNEQIPVIGICGGYQMLGKKIIDPFFVESEKGEETGLGLLNMETTMEKEKTTTRISGLVENSFMSLDIEGSNAEGYEIHMGVSTPEGETRPFIFLEDKRYDGAVTEDGLVMGTYLHGIFDNDDLREKIVQNLRNKKGLKDNQKQFDYQAFKEEQYEALAHLVEKSVDIDKIMELIGLKPC